MTTLTMKEEKRLDVIQRVYRGDLMVGRAALVLGVSERQCYRIKARVSKAGAKGVVHGNRGRRCKRKIKEKVVKRIVELAKGKYKTSKIIIWPTSSKSKKRSHCLGRNCASSFVPTPSHHRGSDVGSSTAAGERDERVRG